ncbi:flagellin [Legionella fairfieldensis]|uniref:flagellin N-terminal helical domain-containing protein n=1 Tax=Legionella fairfieldensis TaxID=45064 RepID=UPI00048F295E|nr:flagellin [Legionella fairfieldensis]
MTLVINTNVMSINAQRNLNISQEAMQTAIQRLSSGLRINSAKDDAAGMVISEGLTSQVNGMEQAIRNANDGISLAQTAEGAMQETTSILQRMRQLALQAANSTNNSEDSHAIQQEISQLQQEINRNAQDTQYNGQSILNGSFSHASFQVGANANQTISFTIGSLMASAIGSLASVTGTAVSAGAATDITVALGSGAPTSISSSAGFVGENTTSQTSDSAYAKLAAIRAAGISDLQATAITEGTTTVAGIGGTAADTYNLTINGVDIFTSLDVSTALSNSSLITGINNMSSQTGVIASLNGGDITLTAHDGSNIVIVESGTGFVAGTDGLVNAGGDFTGGTLRGTLSFTASSAITFGGTIATLGLTNDTVALDARGVSSIDVTTIDGAQEAIMRIDSALSAVNSNRAAMGALQNRFDLTIANLQNVQENLSAARSRIQDTDFAAETANLTKGQILQQAGTAMLAQANSLPQSVLKLLG